jgi:hypothetical protein
MLPAMDLPLASAIRQFAAAVPYRATTHTRDVSLTPSSLKVSMQILQNRLLLCGIVFFKM